MVLHPKTGPGRLFWGLQVTHRPSNPHAPTRTYTHTRTHTHTHKHTPGSTSLNNLWARCRGHCFHNTQHKQETNIRTLSGIRTLNPSSRVAQICALNCTACGIGLTVSLLYLYDVSNPPFSTNTRDRLIGRPFRRRAYQARGKGKCISIHAKKACGGADVYLPAFLTLALD